MNLPQKPQPTLGLSAPGQAGYNPAWYAAGTIFIDPAAGNDANAGTSSGAPIQTYAECVRRWGTTSPQLSVDTTITFLSSHVDNTDSVTWTPYCALGAAAVLKGTTPTVVTAGVVLAGVTSLNRTAGANSPLIATLGATAAVGQMVINTTGGKSSRAFVKKNLGGNSFELSVPMAPQTVPTTTAPTEVLTWANGDTVNLVQLINVNVVDAACVIVDPNLAFTNALTLFQLTCFDPAGAGSSTLSIGTNTAFSECAMQRFFLIGGAAESTNLVAVPFFNCLFQGGGFGVGSQLFFVGGAAITTTWSAFQVCSIIFDGDFAIDVVSSFQTCSMTFGLCYLGANMAITGAKMANSNVSYGAHVLYGRAAAVLALAGTCRAVMTTGTWVAGWTAPTLITGVNMNGGTVAQTHTNATPDVVTSGVTTSVANADAATGGNMVVWGGASLSKAA